MLSRVLNVAGRGFPRRHFRRGPCVRERRFDGGDHPPERPEGQTETLPPKAILKLRQTRPRTTRQDPANSGWRFGSPSRCFRAAVQPGQPDILVATVARKLLEPFLVDIGEPGKPLAFTFTAQWRPPGQVAALAGTVLSNNQMQRTGRGFGRSCFGRTCRMAERPRR